MRPNFIRTASGKVVVKRASNKGYTPRQRQMANTHFKRIERAKKRGGEYIIGWVIG